MRPRAVLVVHRDTMVAEGITAALAAYPAIAPLPAATSAGDASERAGVEAVAIDGDLPGAEALAAQLRRKGARVVVIGDARPDQDEVRVPLAAPVSALATALVPTARPRAVARLTPQEERILSLVARGLTARQVATRLGISHKTVEHHKGRIFRRLGVPNQAAAVALNLGAKVSVP